MLYLYWRICFGTQRHADAAALPDLSAREWWLLAPIVLAVFWMGIYPESFLRMRATTWAACSSEWSGWCRPGIRT